jgi:hypothetical protein
MTDDARTDDHAPIKFTETIVPVVDEQALEEARHWIVTRDDKGGITITRVDDAP